MGATLLQDPANYVFASPPQLGAGPVRDHYERLFRGLAHKLNNQTSVVHGFSSLLLMQKGLDDSSRESVTHMKDAAAQTSVLMSRVLLLAGCGRTNPQEMNPGELFTMLDRSMRELADSAGVSLTVHIEKNLPSLRADSSRMRELVFELLGNAIDAAAAGGGQVAVDVLGPGMASPADPPGIDIFIRNSGSSLAQTDIARLLEPFQGTKGSEHFGLGLPTAATLTEAFGGRLGLRSEDGTTTAWLHFPAIVPA